MTSPKINSARTRAREDENLLHALLARLVAASLADSSNVGLYHAVIERCPATAVLCAYETARNLPAPLVKKSRGAYFVSLINSLCPRPASSPSPPEPAPPASPSSAPQETSTAST